METDDYRVDCVVPDPYNTRGETVALAAAVQWLREQVVRDC